MACWILKCPRMGSTCISVKHTDGALVIGDVSLWDKRWAMVPQFLSAISMVGYWGATPLWETTRC